MRTIVKIFNQDDQSLGQNRSREEIEQAANFLESGADNTTREFDAEKKITGWRLLPPGIDRPRALITGGSSGIGRGTALVLAEMGYDLAITYRSHPDEALEVKEYIEKRWIGRCFVYELDTSDEAQILQVVADAAKDLGGIDLLMNNAGITIFEEAFEDETENMDKLWNVNFRGAMITLREVAKVMKEQEFGGSIVNISSIHGQNEDERDAIYGATKAAMERATRTYAMQYGPHNIRVNTIAPGAIMVDRTRLEGHGDDILDHEVPLGRIGLPRDIAHAVAFLASERASYITGITLLIDGGMALG